MMVKKKSTLRALLIMLTVIDDHSKSLMFNNNKV